MIKLFIRIKKFVFKNLIRILFVSFIILQTTTFGAITYLQYNQIKTLQKDYTLLKKIQNKDIKSVKEAVKQLSSYFQDRGTLTIEALSATVDRLEGAIEVYDNNVDIYNTTFDNINNKIADLYNKLNVIINYLSR